MDLFTAQGFAALIADPLPTCRSACLCRPESSFRQSTDQKPPVAHHLGRLQPELPIRVRQKTNHESTPRPERAGCGREPARRSVPALNNFGTKKGMTGIF